MSASTDSPLSLFKLFKLRFYSEFSWEINDDYFYFESIN